MHIYIYFFSIFQNLLKDIFQYIVYHTFDYIDVYIVYTYNICLFIDVQLLFVYTILVSMNRSSIHVYLFAHLSIDLYIHLYLYIYPSIYISIIICPSIVLDGYIILCEGISMYLSICHPLFDLSNLFIYHCFGYLLIPPALRKLFQRGSPT